MMLGFSAFLSFFLSFLFLFLVKKAEFNVEKERGYLSCMNLDGLKQALACFREKGFHLLYGHVTTPFLVIS